MPEPALDAFLGGRGPDGVGRFIETVLAFGDDALEAHHDYIQWLFPLPEPSLAVPGSPILLPRSITAISEDATARQNIDRATAMMAGFYARRTHWLAQHDHNHLRITRIVRSVRLLRGAEPARAFLDGILARVEAAGTPVSARSLEYWRDAVGADGPGK